MSTPADSIIEHWNRSFRGWSQNYIKPHKAAIIENCLFSTVELEHGHSSALREIEKNKGNIAQFVFENTEQKYSAMLPSKMLSDAYSFALRESEYTMVYKTTLDRLISWKPGTSNALSKCPLDIYYGDEHFMCKLRKYQLESMKKFIQATPGTKEIKGQWSVNVANDSMMVPFGQNNELVVVIKIGSFYDKLNIMYEENSVLRKNSKIRKQTLKTSCWGLEKTRTSSKFDNSIIIQENYGIDIAADDVLSISPIMVYVKKHVQMQYNMVRMNDIDININKRPFHIENIVIPSLSAQDEETLRAKYRNSLLNGAKNKKKNKNTVVKKEKQKNKKKVARCAAPDDFYPIKPIEEEQKTNGGTICTETASPLSIHSDNMELFNPFSFNAPLNDYNYNEYNDPIYPWDDSMNMNMMNDVNMMNMNNDPINEMDEIQRLRHENELLLQKVADQQRHIEYLASQIQTIHSTAAPFPFDVYHPQRHNPLKRRRISVESLLPPAA